MKHHYEFYFFIRNAITEVLSADGFSFGECADVTIRLIKTVCFFNFFKCLHLMNCSESENLSAYGIRRHGRDKYLFCHSDMHICVPVAQILHILNIKFKN